MSVMFRRELALLSVICFFLLIIGGVTDALKEIFLGFFAAYLIWNLYNLNRLANWLNSPSKNTPETYGIWDVIYYQLYQLYQRQRKARRKLTSILTRFQESTQALPYATVVLNEHNEIEWFNQAAGQMFSLNTGRDVGQKLDNLIRDPKFTTYINQKDFTRPLEFEYSHKQINVNITPYGSGQYLLSARDITQRRQLDAMRRDFIANASHELRTPITVISGYIEAMQESAQDNDSIRQPLLKIEQQTARMMQILEELITLAKLESGDVAEPGESVDIAAILAEIHDEAIAMDKGKHNITLTNCDASVTGNGQELRMAFSNLVTNAIRYTPAGRDIHIYCERDEKTVRVGVQDQGIGIAYKHIPRLTERFYRVDPGRSREQGGTGLGLAIVKHVLDRHKAKLLIKSRPGVGSLFRCDFPVSDYTE